MKNNKSDSFLTDLYKDIAPFLGISLGLNLDDATTVQEKYRRYPRPYVRYILFLLFVVAIVAINNATVSYNGIVDRGAALVRDAFKGLASPSKEVMLDMGKTGLIPMLIETFAIGFLSTVIGAIIALPFAFISSRNIAPRWVNLLFLSLITIIRSFPSVMYGIMFVKTVGPGPFAGVLTMTIGSVGMLSKMMVEAIEDIDKGVIEALDAAGCTSFQKMRYGIIPQLSSSLISSVLYRFDINIKNASVLGLVGAGGIGAQLIFAIDARRWSDTGAMLWGVAAMTLAIEYISTAIRKKLAIS